MHDRVTWTAWISERHDQCTHMGEHHSWCCFTRNGCSCKAGEVGTPGWQRNALLCSRHETSQRAYSFEWESLLVCYAMLLRDTVVQRRVPI